MSKRNLKLALLPSLITLLTSCEGHPTVLNPKGVVAFEERQIFFDSAALMSIVVFTVIIMSFIFVYHYREDNHKTEYKPNWCHSLFLECLWWGIPCLIILVLSIYTWISTHQLDPYRKLNYPGPTLKIQAIALPWKWLFIYPDYNIATVNKLVLPNNKQVELFLTSDNVPMSSFFIPQLGSQIYTMAGMQTKLHLIPTHLGTIEGFNSQYNGDGFSNMRFTVDVVNQQEFNTWQKNFSAINNTLTLDNYNKLREYSFNNKQQYYFGIENNLFNKILHSYMKSGKHPVKQV